MKSRATDNVIVSTAPLLIPYANRSWSATFDAIEARFTIAPPPAASNCGTPKCSP